MPPQMTPRTTCARGSVGNGTHAFPPSSSTHSAAPSPSLRHRVGMSRKTSPQHDTCALTEVVEVAACRVARAPAALMRKTTLTQRTGAALLMHASCPCNISIYKKHGPSYSCRDHQLTREGMKYFSRPFPAGRGACRAWRRRAEGGVRMGGHVLALRAVRGARGGLAWGTGGGSPRFSNFSPSHMSSSGGFSNASLCSMTWEPRDLHNGRAVLRTGCLPGCPSGGPAAAARHGQAALGSRAVR